MTVIAMIVLGLVAGAIAKLTMPGRDPAGMVWTILLGIAGSLVGGFLFYGIGVGARGFWSGLAGSTIGAAILLAAYRAAARRGIHPERATRREIHPQQATRREIHPQQLPGRQVHPQ